MPHLTVHPKEVRALGPHTLTSDQALQLCLDNGFELIRSGKHKLVMRGTLKFSLPSTGSCSAWLSQQISNKIAEVQQNQSGDRPTRHPLQPLMVTHAGRTWAVAGQDAIHYYIQSLEDGMSRYVRKSTCKISQPTHIPLVKESIMQSIIEDVKDGYSISPPPNKQSSPHTFMTTPLAEWLVSTRRLMDRIALDIARLEGQLKPLRTQHTQLTTVLESVSGVTASPATVSVQPLTSRSKRKQVDHSTLALIMEYWIDGGPATTGISVPQKAKELHCSTSAIYNRRPK